MKRFILILLSFIIFSYSDDFKPLETDKEYLFKYFDREENIDTKSKLKLISINQKQEFIITESKSGKTIRISKVDLHHTQRPYLFKSSWDEKQAKIEAAQETKQDSEVMKIVVGKTYKLPLMKGGELKMYDCLIKAISEETVVVEYDEDRKRTLYFNDVPLTYAKVLFPVKYKDVMEIRDKYHIGTIQVGDIKSKPRYRDKYLYFIPKKINKNIKDITIRVSVTSEKYNFYKSFSIIIKDHEVSEASSFCREDELEDKKNLFIKSLKSDDLKIRITYGSGRLINDEVFKLPNTPYMDFVNIDFSFWQRL